MILAALETPFNGHSFAATAVLISVVIAIRN